MIKYAIALILLIVLFLVLNFNVQVGTPLKVNKPKEWEIKSIDTVKYSRDLAREKSKDPSFLQTIDSQVKLISETGATHIAVGTPYDPEFLPFLKHWVKSARKYNLKVWFRGNFSGWEGWFNYPSIDKETHIKNTEKFIRDNGELFEAGDIFSSCPECENGAFGDPRLTGKVNEYRNFLVEEYRVISQAFRDIGKGVRSNYFSMNADVAKLVMDKETTNALGGTVVIDHYVASPEKMIEDINNLREISGGKVVLGEFGLPIIDIHGEMDENRQSKVLNEFLQAIKNSEIEGINYWTSFGGSTELWKSDFSEKPAVEILKNYYKVDK